MPGDKKNIPNNNQNNKKLNNNTNKPGTNLPGSTTGGPTKENNNFFNNKFQNLRSPSGETNNINSNNKSFDNNSDKSLPINNGGVSLNNFNNKSGNPNLAGDIKKNAAKAVANKVAPGIGGKVVDAAYKLNDPSKKQNGNKGKNILKSSNNITNPASTPLNDEKEKNSNKLQEQIKKNAVRAAANAFLPGVGGALVDAADKVKKQSEKSSSKKNNNKDGNNSNKKNNKFLASLNANPTIKLIVQIAVPLCILIVIILIPVMISLISINRFNDLVGVGSSGLEAKPYDASNGDKKLEDLYNRIMRIQQEYNQANPSKYFSSDVMAAVYHILNERNSSINPSDFSDSVIRDIANYMFDETCVENKDEKTGKVTKTCTYSYSESTFKNNLINVIFPRYLRANICSKAADEVFEYIKEYRQMIGYKEPDQYGGFGGSGIASCSDISLTGTSLTRDAFIAFVNQFYGSGIGKVFADNAGKIYDISTQNGFNPEMVVIRARSEGFAPGGGTNNYWGIGCTNTGGRGACKTYSSLDAGILAYIQITRKADTLLNLFYKNHYAFIGSYWLPNGNSSTGGCYYYPYIKKYMTPERAATVGAACSSSCGGSSCLATNDEDQLAYSKYQMENSLKFRSDIFKISSTDCTQTQSGSSTSVSGGDGAAVVNYAVQTFDNYLYSQAQRMSDGYVDCSSMVSRAYDHFGVKIYDGGNTSGEIYRWCEKNNKTITASELQPGDLIFYNTGTYSNRSNYLNIGHVAMYYQTGQIFAAHTARKAPADQVSITNYYNNGSLFCRPLK